MGNQLRKRHIPKQIELFELGATKRERLFKCSKPERAKVSTAALETAYHVTGRYQPGWKGHRFTKPIAAWVCSETAIVLRDVMQKLMFGEPGDPESVRFRHSSPRSDRQHEAIDGERHYGTAYDTVRVKHVSGGIST